MLDIQQIASFYPPYLAGYTRHILREYLQYKILQYIFDQPNAQKLCFMGGTAIHLAYGSPRFSEDLDFDNRGLNEKDFKMFADTVKAKLAGEGIEADTETACKDAWHIYVTCRNVLYTQGISRHREETLVIRIDAQAQDYVYDPASTLINKFDVFTKIPVAGAELLLAQKFACLLTRRRQLGRDYFDITYLLGKSKPEMRYLSEKCAINDPAVLKDRITRLCAKLDFNALAKNVEPFLFQAADTQRIKEFPTILKNTDLG